MNGKAFEMILARKVIGRNDFVIYTNHQDGAIVKANLQVMR